MKKVAILGGTFDPIHKQHVKIAKLAHKKFNLDEIWILPTKLNPLKVLVSATDVQRLKMIEMAAAKYSFIKIKDYELNVKSEVTYTIDTISHFSQFYPDYKFYFIIGSDNLHKLNNWKKIDKLTSLLQFIVVNRPGFKKNSALMKKYQCLSLNIIPSSKVNSTEIRNGENIKCLDRSVIYYINSNLIYYYERLQHNMDQNRLTHSINVGNTSLLLAKQHGVDQHAALIAGTYHDIAKQWSKDKLSYYLRKYYPEGLQTHENIFHALVGALYLKHHYKYKNSAIVKAISKHTTGSIKMSKLDLVVFLADKISSERQYPGVEEIRELAFKDLEQAFVVYLKFLKNEIIKKNYNVGKDFSKIYSFWTKK